VPSDRNNLRKLIRSGVVAPACFPQGSLVQYPLPSEMRWPANVKISELGQLLSKYTDVDFLVLRFKGVDENGVSCLNPLSHVLFTLESQVLSAWSLHSAL